MLERQDVDQYIYTQMNFTTFKLLKNFFCGLPIPEHFPWSEYFTVFDSLVTMYQAVKANFRSRGHCQWLGQSHLYPMLAKVGLK